MSDPAFFEEPVWILSVLALSVAAAEWLARRPVLRHVGAALLVIVVTAVISNLGVIPVYEAGDPVYDGVFSYGVYVGVFWLLLRVNLADVRKAGAPMLILFAIGAAGTVTGAVVATAVVDGPAAFGEHSKALGGMFVATYVGGSANLNLLAAQYGVAEDGLLYTGTNAVDAILTTVWMVCTIVIPRVLWRVLPRRKCLVVPAKGDGRAATEEAAAAAAAELDGDVSDAERVNPLDLGVLLALGGGAYWASTHLTEAINRWLDANVPMALVLTTLALVLAQVPAVSRLRGVRVLGMFAVYLFLAVIGVLCDLSALDRLGELAASLWIFAATVIAVHGLVCFGLAGLFGLDWDMAAVASQANVGGGTSALALARSLGRADLVLPSILVGAVGTAAGAYLGIFAVDYLL